MASFLRWNRKMQRVLWLIVALGVMASLPMAAERWQTEQSSGGVEIVFDFADLLVLSEFEAEPQTFMDQELAAMQGAGVTTIAIYEATLVEMQQTGHIKLYTPLEAALLEGSSWADPDTRHTYLLFSGEQERAALQPIIERYFASLDVPVHRWDVDDRAGLRIEMSQNAAQQLPMEPNPLLLDRLHGMGFQLAARLSDRPQLDMAKTEEMIRMLHTYGVRTIIFAGQAVTGFTDDAEEHTLTAMAELMNEYGIRIALIETDPSKPQQKGAAKLAYLTDYEAVRLHSILEGEMFQSPATLSDRMVLAVTDRNIRMIYLNASIQRDTDTAFLKNSLFNMRESLKGPDGAVQRIQEEGFRMGEAETFTVADFVPADKLLKLVVLAGVFALAALLAGMFFQWSPLLVFVGGLIGGAGLYVLSPMLLLQAAALLAAISAPSLAVILAIRTLARKHGREQGFSSSREGVVEQKGDTVGLAGWLLIGAPDKGMASSWLGAVGLLLRTVAISLIGIIYVVGLLHTITYLLAIDLFRGVSLLKLAPIGIVVLYYIFFRDELSLERIAGRVKAILMANIKVVYIVILGIVGVVGLYYLSRAGNAGTTLPYERAFRAFLENTLGVRPRTQEFLIGHPLLIAGAYLCLRYRKGLLLVVLGVIGQLTMVNTFTHLHTPLDISMLRVTYGVAFGLLVSVVLAGVLEVLIRSWRKWAHLFRVF
ncbi:DUF5693 family protein [Xylanibacillus composti]|uniref:DUF5693 family protein n=1 Tax=Xylanibacillus composti TaxID=1572762 RepID=UPI001BCAD343|nr:DUF5693 family protein [Xylanibacillus composti]